jgi:GNAT superfamily N-acetyltransferase
MRSSEWPDAARLVGRAIFDEPYMKVAFGEDPLARFVQVSEFFGDVDSTREGRLVAGVWAGTQLLSLAGAFEPGGCPFCRPAARDQPPSDDPWDVAFRQIDPKITAAHEGLAPHWYVAPVATEPALQGSGFGRMAMEGLVALAMEQTPAPMTLDCAPYMTGFYERVGFEVTADVSDDRIELISMVRDVSAPR